MMLATLRALANSFYETVTGLRLPGDGGDFRHRRRANPEPGRDVKIKRDILLLAAVSAAFASCGPNDPQAQLEARFDERQQVRDLVITSRCCPGTYTSSGRPARASPPR